MDKQNLKRLAVISYHTCPMSCLDNEIGGMNTYVLELSRALSKKGYLVDIFTRCPDPGSAPVINEGNLRLIHLKAGPPSCLPKKQLSGYLDEFSKHLLEFISKEKSSYCLISCHYYLSGMIGLQLKAKLKIPLSITFHTLGLMKNLVAKTEEEREDEYRIKAENLLVKKSDQVFCTSLNDISYLQSLYLCPMEKISLLTPGVNLSLFKPMDKIQAKKFTKADPNHKILLFVGRLAPLKGIDVLLYAVKILSHKHPADTLCLWVIGDKGKEFRRLKKLCFLLGINPYVKFIGIKNTLELPFYYNSAEMVVMPSYYESFGIVALEAMACGVPVIVTDTSGVSGLLDKEHTDLLASANNPIMLAKRINNLLSNRKRRKLVSQKVYLKVQNLSWDNVADKFIQISKSHIPHPDF